MSVLILSTGVWACVGASSLEAPGRPSTDVIELRIGYPQAFDRVVRLLEQEGYEVEADERSGLIRTAPKTREGTGGIAYEVAVVVRMGGTGRESWLTMDQVAMPTFPDEERRLEDALKGLAP